MKFAIALLCAGVLLTAGCSSSDDSAGDSSSSSTTASTAASGSGTTASAAGETYDVTGDTTIQATVGETFTISLEANKTTGYNWSEKIEGDAITSDGGTYEAPGEAMPGKGGRQLYTYTAASAGTATIELTYSQVGSGDVGQQYTVTVEVS